MFELNIKIVIERLDERLPARLRSLVREIRPISDYRLEVSRVANHPAVVCYLYLDEKRFQNALGQEVLSILSYIRSNIESTGTRVLQMIVGDYDPPSSLLRHRNGLWGTPGSERVRDLRPWLIEFGAQEIDEWLFLPFRGEEVSDDADYELCDPDEKLTTFGRRVNGSPKRAGAPISLKVRMAEGRRLSEYISTTFSGSLESFPNLGGENVVLTTLLQMNDRLDMVNHYSERLQRDVALNLYSLSAMNLSLADVRDETDIAVLTSSGKLVLEDIKLGE